MSERRVVVTGLGLVTPLGDHPADVHQALCAGTSGVEVSNGEGGAETAGAAVAPVRNFTVERYLGSAGNVRPLDRSGRLLAAAAALALADAGLSVELREREAVGLVAGTLFGGLRTIGEFDRRQLEAGPTYVKPLDFANSVINAAAGQAAIWHRLPGVNTTLAGGPTAGLQAIAYAADLIRAGRANVILAGGFEELSPEDLLVFARAGMLRRDGDAAPRPLDARRRGFALGEGAALLVLEEEGAARQRGARILARVLAGASGADGARGASEEASAAALARAIHSALAEAGVAGDDVDAISLSARGSQPLDRAEAQAIGRAFGGRAATLPVTAVKSMLGESLGAAGALQAIALVLAMHDGRWPGIAGLEELESGLPLGAASAATGSVEIDLGLVTALGLDGGVCAVALERATS
jgi:3-oxoacyl-[acyl-carrier-protein] synthase II